MEKVPEGFLYAAFLGGGERVRPCGLKVGRSKLLLLGQLKPSLELTTAACFSKDFIPNLLTSLFLRAPPDPQEKKGPRYSMI